MTKLSPFFLFKLFNKNMKIYIHIVQPSNPNLCIPKITNIFHFYGLSFLVADVARFLPLCYQIFVGKCEFVVG
jgi:hypothetical protein